MAEKSSSRSGVGRSEHKAAVLALKPAPGPRASGLRWGDNVATVSVRGDLDRDALWAIDYTIGRAAIEAGRIVLDLREVTHLDYGGVPEIVARRKELLSRGGDLLIAVRKREEQRLELRRRDVDAVCEQVTEESAVPVRVACLRILEVGHDSELGPIG